MNRISVFGDASTNAQARIYAEYRVFAALAPHMRSIRRVRIVLRHTENRRACDAVTCVVTVGLEPAGSLRIRTTGPHVYAAINRAVERLSSLGRGIEQPAPASAAHSGRRDRAPLISDDDAATRTTGVV